MDAAELNRAWSAGLTAELLLDHGADLNWVGYDRLTPLDAAIRGGATDVADWLRGRGATSAGANA